MSETDQNEHQFQTFLTELVTAAGKRGEGEWGKTDVHFETCKSCRVLARQLRCYRDTPLFSGPGVRDHTKLQGTEDAIRLCWDKQVARRNNAVKKRYELGAREFTLTYSPKWMSDDDARLKMRTAVQRLIKYYEAQIVELRATGEVGSNGLSHVHCFYKLDGGLKITDKNFKRAWPYWNPKKPLQRGFEGGHHATVRNESDFKGYIDKDIDTAWLDIMAPMPADPTATV